MGGYERSDEVKGAWMSTAWGSYKGRVQGRIQCADAVTPHDLAPILAYTYVHIPYLPRRLVVWWLWRCVGFALISVSVFLFRRNAALAEIGQPRLIAKVKPVL